MSPRKPAVLRDGGDQNLRDHLIATAARLISERGSAGLAVRDISREAQVADGVLYNYFEDKEDLLAHALLAHVASVMHSAQRLLPEAGTGTVAGNLRSFLDEGLQMLSRLVPAFAGLVSQPGVLTRFHAMVGGSRAFGTAADDIGQGFRPAPDSGHGQGHEAGGGRGLAEILTGYLRAEQRLGRLDPAADMDAASTLIIGAIHGQVLPQVLLHPPGTPVAVPPGWAGRLAETVVRGIAPHP